MRYVRFNEVVNLSSCSRGFFIFVPFIVPVGSRVQPIIVRVILELFWKFHRFLIR